MRHLLLCLTIFLSLNSKAQWFSVNQDTTFRNSSIFFLNADTGFVVGADYTTQGDFGVISRTKDGGLTWDSLTVQAYTATVHFPTVNIGYTGGQDGAVYKTIDMGNSWNFLGVTSFGDDYSNCYFLSADTGFVWNWFGNMLNTTNGGVAWNFLTTIGGFSPYPGLGSIQFINDSAGIIAAGQYGTYAYTKNKGLTWQVGHIDSNMFVITIHMRNSNNGYAVGNNGKFSRTFDGGQTWTSPIILSQYNLTDIDFFTDSIGYIVGGDAGDPSFNSSKGIILKTLDGGNSWAVEDSSYNGWLTSINVVNDSVGYAAGWNGRILKITNGNSVGINENLLSGINIKISPNPFSNQTTLRSDKFFKNASFTVHNSFGQIVNQMDNLAGQEIIFNRDNLPSGLYLFRITQDNKIISAVKLVIVD